MYMPLLKIEPHQPSKITSQFKGKYDVLEYTYKMQEYNYEQNNNKHKAFNYLS